MTRIDELRSNPGAGAAVLERSWSVPSYFAVVAQQRSEKGAFMSKRLIVLMAVALVAISIPAQAAKPGSSLPPGQLSFVGVISVCGFDVLLEQEGKTAVLAFDSGRIHTFDPGMTATLTNLSTEETITLNAAGPSQITETAGPDGGFTGVRTATGNWLHFHPDGIIYTSGYWTQTVVVDDMGNLVSSEEDLSRARVVDLCQELS
jgi:hypothetical protein